MVKKLVGVILFAAIILPASSASAQGLTDQINLLLTRISELQEQVKNLQSQQTSQGAVNREGSSDGTTDANVRFTTDLYYRMPGQPHVQVRALQEILVTKGFLIAPEEINVVNGYFGPLTLTAVQAFQREYDIFPSNGFVGPLTRAVLHRIFYDPGAGRGSDTGSTDPKQNEIDALPRVKFSATPIQLPTKPGKVTLNWSSINATSCTSSWISGRTATQGTQDILIDTTTTFKIYCGNTLGSSETSSVTVLIDDTTPEPSFGVYLFATPSSITAGQSATLKWSSTSAKSCSASEGNWSTGGLLRGESIVSPSETTTYRITCQNNAGQNANYSFVLIVNPPTTIPGPTVTLESNLTSVTSGKLISLTWKSTNANTCTLNADYIPVQPYLLTSGTISRVVSKTTDFSISCSGPAGIGVSNSVRVNVVAPTITPAPSVDYFTVTPTSVTSGQLVSLKWTSTNATTCLLLVNGFAKLGIGTSGELPYGPINETTTFSITCINKTGNGYSEAVTVTVTPATTFPASATLSSASPARGTTGTVINLKGSNLSNTSSLYFYKNGQRRATLSGYSYFLSNTSESVSFILPKFFVDAIGADTYQIQAVTASGPSSLINFEIYAPVTTLPVPTVTFSISSPASVIAGNLVSLAWLSTNATSCALNADGTQVLSSLIPNGKASRVVYTTTTFTVTCTGSGGTATSYPLTVTVTVPTTTDGTNSVSPNIFSLSPTRGKIGDTVTISGKGLTGTYAVELRRNGTLMATIGSSAISYVSASSVVFRIDSSHVPSSLAGDTYLLNVVTPSGISSDHAFTLDRSTTSAADQATLSQMASVLQALSALLNQIR